MAATEAPARRRHWFVEFYGTTVGKKWVMAITGIILMGFVLFHLIGNLKFYLPAVDGVPDIDIYGEWLRELLVPFLPHHAALWIMRVGLIAAAALHVEAMISLTVKSPDSLPGRYEHKPDYQAATYAARTMRLTGPLVLAFVIFHLADLTWGLGRANPDFIAGEIQHNMIASLSRAGVAAFYIIANLALGFHLYHGAWSLFQSMGWNNPRFNTLRQRFAQGFTAIVVLGNLSFPIVILAGLVKEV